MTGLRTSRRVQRCTSHLVLGSALFAASVVASLATSAGAVSARTTATRAGIRPHLAESAPIALGSAPSLGSDQLVAFAPGDSYTYVAWNSPTSTGIDLCIVPPAATSCDGGAPVLLTDPLLTGDTAPVLAGLNVLSNGDVVVDGASAAGGSGTYSWASTAGGGSFLTSGNGLQNGGQEISPVSLYYTVNNVAPLSGTDLGLLDSYGDLSSGGFFSDSPFAGPKTPTSLPSPNADTSGTYDRKSLEVLGPEVAAEAAPPPAATGADVVVSVGDTFASGALAPGCSSPYLATGYGAAAGTVGGVAGGSLNKETGLKNYGLIACEAESPVLASGGGAGIGVVEEEGTGASYPGVNDNLNVDWRGFAATATGGSFGAPVTISDISSENLAGAIDFDAAEDGAKGVYASWVDEKGLMLSYSPNSGASWDGVAMVPALSGGATQSNPVIAAVANGLGVVAYEANTGSGNQVFLQSVDFLPPAPTTIATSQTAGVVVGTNLSIPESVHGETDSATLAGTNAATATGTFKYGLYKSSTCATAAVFTSSVAVAGGTVPASSPVTSALAPGKYYWKDAYSGDEFNQASSSACGSESLTVAPISAPSSAPTTGTSVTLTITCSGPCTVTVTIDLPSAGSSRATGFTARSRKLTAGKFTLRRKGKERLRLKWSKYARSLLKHDHDKLKTLLVMKGKVAKTKFTTESGLRIRR
jgi:hypothetical protein